MCVGWRWRVIDHGRSVADATAISGESRFHNLQSSFPLVRPNLALFRLDTGAMDRMSASPCRGELILRLDRVCHRVVTGRAAIRSGCALLSRPRIDRASCGRRIMGRGRCHHRRRDGAAVLTMGSCVWVRIVKDLFLMAGRNLCQDGRGGGTPETMVRIRLCQDRKR